MSSSPRHRAKGPGGVVTEEESSAASLSVAAVLSKALTPKAVWTDKDDILDVVYWGRQLVGLGMGVGWGLVPFHGLLAILLYVALSSLAGYLYVTRFQGWDEEELGGFWELSKEGFGAAFASFLVAWIVTYSALHADEPHQPF